MNPKIRDEVAVAIGVAAVYMLIHKKGQARMALLTAVGAATALWVVHSWQNAEE